MGHPAAAGLMLRCVPPPLRARHRASPIHRRPARAAVRTCFRRGIPSILPQLHNGKQPSALAHSSMTRRLFVAVSL